MFRTQRKPKYETYPGNATIHIEFYRPAITVVALDGDGQPIVRNGEYVTKEVEVSVHGKLQTLDQDGDLFGEVTTQQLSDRAMALISQLYEEVYGSTVAENKHLRAEKLPPKPAPPLPTPMRRRRDVGNGNTKPKPKKR